MKKTIRQRAADIACLALAILPLIGGMVLKVLTHPQSDGVEITGAHIFFTIPMPLQDLPITESQVNSWLVILSVLGLSLFLTRNLRIRDISIRQHIAEWIVEKTDALVRGNMGEYFMAFSPFVCAVMALSALSSLLTLIGLFPPTSDLNVVAGWAILVTILITHYKLKAGPVHYIKSFGDPVPFLAPLNIISEVATPVSMSFRHYGNVLSGTVISALLASSLSGLSALLLGWLPAGLSDIAFLQIGLPAVLSVYFDIFSGCMQAFIFAMLTMLYISGGFPYDEWAARKKRREARRAASRQSTQLHELNGGKQNA